MRNQRIANHFVASTKILLVTFVFSLVSAAQTTSATDGSTPLGLQPGAPAGSYALSGFDNVNLYNGNLSFQLSLLGVSGRGGAQMPVMLPITGKWRIADVAIPQIGGGVTHRYLPLQSWWENNERKYSPGSMAGRQAGLDEIECPDGTEVFAYSITRLTFTAPDGTEYELRDQLTGGQPANNGLCNYLSPQSRGTVFITADGSAATFISDTTIYDQPISPNPGEIYPSGYLLLRDGTRYRFDAGVVSWVRDRNGNKLTFTYDGFNRVSTITDSLKRQATISYNTGPGTSDQITYKGFGGTSRSILVNHASLANALRSDYSGTRTYKSLFPESDGSSTTQHNPTVVASITLPNGKQYQFKYNQYGELARVILPTGGATEYDYAAGITNDYASGMTASGYQGSLVIYRRVTERRLYPDGGTGSTYASRMTYSRPETLSSNAGYVTADQLNNSGTLLTRSKHYFYGSPKASFAVSPIDYAGWKEGKEYQTENFASNGTTVLTRMVNTFQQRAAVSWWTGSADLAPSNDSRLSETTNTLVDTNQVSKQTFSYDDTVPFNNRSDVYDYAFGSGTAGSLVRQTHTDYLKTNPVNSTDYTTTTIHIRSLPTQIQVFDGAVEKARTTFEYDNYASDSNHAPLLARSNISGLDSAFTTSYVTRGNLTRTTGWILSSSTQLHSYAQYDVAGNVLKTIDARGYATVLEFADRFGTADAEAQGNTAPSELGGQTSYAFATKVTNAAGHIAYAQFDYYLGRPVNGEDANGIVASGSYNDSLDRPTQIVRARGTGAENQTTFEYDDTAREVTTKSDRDSNADNGLINKVVYDGFGRSIETKQYEGGSNFIRTEQQYDALGRAYKVSNPYRPYLSETAVWTTTAFDTLGRVTSVTTPDSAVVTSAYSGNAATVTDQAGKLRRSIADALGRLIRVDEPDGSNNLDSGGVPIQPTSYTYDVLDNLTGVSQGVQSRTFVYDSLKRLTSATNPESGTVTYGYDANGNLTSKVDARTITTTIAYDAINRVTSKSYNDSPQTPTISYFYDAQSLPSGAPTFDHGYSTGRLVAVTYGSGSSAGAYRGYDQMGRVVRQYQRTDSVNYLVEATYYANSSLNTQTYPAVPGAGDRRVVSYTNDAAGRLGSLNSTATSYAPAAGVSTIGYAAHNALNTETYGNGLIHAIDYNNRLQPTQIKLGTSGSPTSIVSLGYSYGTTNNNGNVQTHTYNGAGLTYTQTFGYDTLNRLTMSSESGSAWSQTNGYDRYGNRWIDLGGGGHSLSFDTANNRITGWSYDAAGNLLNDGSHSYTYDAENKIANVDSVSAYVYDGEGQRVRKLVGENLRFVYGIGGELIAEFSGASGSLQKEYIYGASGLLATIEPTAVNSNGTRYTTSDHLGSPRVVTNSGASVTSRHDYMPFGEELGAGVGGRTTGMGFPGASDNIRQKFTRKERDVETGLDYFLARYYSSTQGRFTSPDEFKGGPEELFGDVDPHDPLFYADTAEPQSLNKYHYCLNNPLRYVDPDGHQTTVADRIRNAAATVRDAAATVVRAAEPVINGASSAWAESNGLGENPGPQSSVGRGVGYAVALAQSGAEILVGASAAVGGGAEAIATSPAVVTVVGAAAPAVGVAVAVGGVVTATHGALVGVNTLNNIFNRNNSGQAPGQTSAGRPTDQHGRPLGPSGEPTIHQINPGGKKAAKDAARNAGNGAPMKDPSPRRGQRHFHPTKNGKKVRDGTHYNY
jgi:RHS repeat-associated protein